MATNSKKKKAVAVATAALLLLGGTFAWQSISQTALNEASDVINPGGRLHDDFFIDDNGEYNSDIYVENFADDEIFARVQLSEYMEIVVNQGVEGAEKVETITGSKSLDGEPVTDKATDNTSGYEYEYVTHYFDTGNATDEYWTLTPGDADSETVYYMPTFNKNKDSLVVDRNGMYVDRVGGISNRGEGQYEEYTVWTDGDSSTDMAIYDADSNDHDEYANGEGSADENWKEVEETHDAQAVGITNGLISMQDWLDNDYGEGAYWVYDEDGWVYWAQPIGAGETTGLLLDGIELNKVMDDSWYYAMNVTGQFVTADDLGKADDTGFYEDPDQVPTDNALTLLERIGVDVNGEAGGGEDDPDDDEEFVAEGTLEGINLSLYSNSEYIKVNENSNTLLVNPDGDWEKVFVTVSFGELNLALGDTTQGIYKWNEESESYEVHGEQVVDINYYEDGLDLDLSDDEAEGRYKLTASYDDNGTTYEGELEFTIKVAERAPRLNFFWDAYYANADNNVGCLQDRDYNYSANYFKGDVVVTLYDEDGNEVQDAVGEEYVNIPAGYNTSYTLVAKDETTTISVNINILDEYRLFINGKPVDSMSSMTECIDRGGSCTVNVYKNDDLENDLASQLEWTAVYSTSSNTKVENGVFTVGADETSGDIRLYATGVHEGNTVEVGKDFHAVSGVLTPVLDAEYGEIAEVTVPRIDGKYVVEVDVFNFEDLESASWISMDRYPTSMNGLTATLEKYKGENVIVVHVDADYIYEGSPYGEFTFTNPESAVSLRVNFTDATN